MAAPAPLSLPSIRQFNADEFDIIEQLGKGAYGSVYKVRVKRTGEIAALKRIELEEDDSVEDSLREIEILKQCHDPHIIRYLDCFREEDNVLYLLMEACTMGAITGLMKITRKTSLAEPQIAYIMYQTLQGLQYLHNQKKIHRDIKGGNILINQNGEVKIADFGVSAILTHTWDKRQTFIGSPYWMAPEILKGEPYSRRVDIWALAITAIELAEGKPPLADVHFNTAMLQIPGRPAPTLRDQGAWSQQFHDFLAACLKKTPVERLDSAQALRHPWFDLHRAALNPRTLAPLIDEATLAQNAARAAAGR